VTDQHPGDAHHHYGRWHTHPGGSQPHSHALEMPSVNPASAATSGFMQGFAGCLGVGVAIALVVIVLAIIVSAGSHN
jgi:hypothetical protein